MALCVLVLVPGGWSTLHEHRLGLSQYAPLVGGARGAAALGLNRGFWGHTVTDVLPDGDELGVGPAYVHDVHAYAITQYRREGRWPSWKRSNPERARVGLIFPELHMTTDEVRLWNAMGGTRPAGFVLLDGVPVTILYGRGTAAAGDPEDP